MTEYATDKYIVRIHSGNRTEEERLVAIKNAAADYYKAILKSGCKL